MRKLPNPDDVEDMKEGVRVLWDVLDELKLEVYFSSNIIGTVFLSQAAECALRTKIDLPTFLHLCKNSYLKIEELIADTDNQNLNNT